MSYSSSGLLTVIYNMVLHLELSHSFSDLLTFAYNQGIIDITRTKTRQIVSRIFVSAKKLKSCLPLLNME